MNNVFVREFYCLIETVLAESLESSKQKQDDKKLKPVSGV